MDMDLIFRVMSIVINVVLAGIVIYKALKKNDQIKFMRKVESVMRFLEKQHKLGNLTKFVETSLEVMTNQTLGAQQVDQIVDFIKQVGAI